MAKQINIFSENRPGKLAKVTGIFSEAKVNILAFKISSSDAYGVLKFIVDDAEKAVAALKDANITTVSIKEVLAVEMEDKPGMLYNVTSYLSKNKVNIEDAYGFVLETGKKAVVVFEVAEAPSAEKVMKEGGFKLV